MIELVANRRYAALDPVLTGLAGSENPMVISLASGGFVAAWKFGNALKAQIFDRHGAPVGGQFNLNLPAAGAGYYPSLAALPSGGFVATWESLSADESLSGISARIFDAVGNPLSAPFTANTTTFAGQQQPAVAALASGGFVIGWTDQNGDANGSGIRAQMFGPTGDKVGAEFTVNTVFGGNQLYPLAVGLPGGGFVISWIDGWYGTSESPSAPSYSAQIFDAQGQRVGGEIELAPYSNGVFDIAVLASGKLLIVWPDSSGELKGQIYSGTGTKDGPEFQVNAPTASSEMMPEIAALPSGGFMVTWRVPTGAVNYSQDGDIRAQLFDAAGAKLGAEFTVNPVTAGGQSEPQIASFGSDDLAVFYLDFNTSGQSELKSRLLFSAAEGTSGPDILAGTADRDFFFGLGGDDTLTGGSSDDALDGGDGNDTVNGDDGNDTINGGDGNDTLHGGSGNDILAGDTGNDFLDLTGGGDDSVSGGAGDDALQFGVSLTAADKVDGGAGDDQLAVQGDYKLTLGPNNLVNVETLALLSSQDNRFGGGSGTPFNYDLTFVDANVAAGQLLTINYNQLRAGEHVRIDASAETDGGIFVYAGRGNDTLIGGASSDAFMFAEGHFTAADKVDGRGGGDDQVGLRGSFTLTFNADTITDIETLALLSAKDTRFGPMGANFKYDLTTHDGNVGAGQRLTVNASPLRATESLVFNGSAETDGSFRILAGQGNDKITGGGQSDFIYGGLGKDELTAGGGGDTFFYRSVAESTSTGFDVLIGFDAREDRIDLPGAVSGFGGKAESGALNSASFDADLKAALDLLLAPGQAAVFTPTSGDMANRTFAVVDANGVAGYQPGEDYVFELAGLPAPLPPSSEFFI